MPTERPYPGSHNPALMMLERVIAPHYKVFEYGCGSSSLWWAKNVSLIKSVEHDEAWAKKIIRQGPSNLQISVRKMCDSTDQPVDVVDAFFARNLNLPLTGDKEADVERGFLCDEIAAYAAEVARDGKGYFDVIVIDGMARSLCTWMAINFIKCGGIIIFDNSERWQYNAAFAMLAEHKFRRIDFYGSGPLNAYEWCTSIFCKDLNWTNCNVAIPR